MAVTKTLTNAIPFEKDSKVEKWDVVFASQVDSVITNPVVNPVPDTAYSIPS